MLYFGIFFKLAVRSMCNLGFLLQTNAEMTYSEVIVILARPNYHHAAKHYQCRPRISDFRTYLQQGMEGHAFFLFS